MKKNLKMLVASVLVFVMLLSLAACGTKTEQTTTGGDVSSRPTNASTETGFTYVSSFKDIDNNNDQGSSSAAFTEDGYYVTTSDVVGQRELEEGETLAYEGQLDIVKEGIAFIGFDGSRKQLENYVPAEATVEEGHDGNLNVTNFTVLADGTIAVLYQQWESWSDAPEGVTPDMDNYYDYYQYKESAFVRFLDPTGAEISRVDVGGDEDYFYVNSFRALGDSLAICGDQALMLYGKSGNVIASINKGGWIVDATTLADGRCVLEYSDNMTGELKLQIVDPSTGNLGEEFPAPRNAYNLMAGSGDYDFFFTSGSIVFGYDIETVTQTKLFSWLDVDVSRDALSSYSARSDGSFVAVTNEWDKNYEHVTSQLVTVERKPLSDVAQKEEITLATQYTNSDLEQAVIRFNRNHDVRIKVLDYSEYNTDEDWQAGIKKLTTEIMSGNLPDILALDQMPYSQLAAKGLLEDLYPYIDNDSTLSRDDFLPNILQALEVNGKLYSTFTTFTIQTLAGAAQVVGDTPGWNFQQLRDALATMPAGARVLDQYTTSGDILRTSLTLDMDHYVDWTTGTCNFDSDDFKQLLEFCKLFPNSFNWDNYDYTDYEDATTAISEGKQMLTQVYISDFMDSMVTEAQFGGNLTYIGYPCSSGVGSVLQLQSGYAMSSKCADKDAAWEFLRDFLTAQGQNSRYNYGFSGRKDLLEAAMKDAMQIEYEKDENGNFKLDENGERIPVSRGGIGYGNGEMIEYYGLTQEMADKLTAVINSTTRVLDSNEALLNMIVEQTDAFFAGQKSADEVAKLVQGKISIYVAEQK